MSTQQNLNCDIQEQNQYDRANIASAITNNISNEYLTSQKYSDPLIQNIKQICGEIDINIEESTGLIYEDDLEQAQLHLQIAIKKLNSAAPLFEKLNQRNQVFLQGGPSTQSSSSENQNNAANSGTPSGSSNSQAAGFAKDQASATQKQAKGSEIHHQHTQSSSIALQNEHLQKIYSVVIYYNMAACYQRRGIFKESHEYITRSIEALKFLIQDYNYLSYLEPNPSGRITPKANLNPQHAASCHPPQQPVLVAQASTSQGQSAQKYKQLIYLRYYAQIVLQSCAIKSQLQDHDGALNSAFDGLVSCIKVFKKSLDLCEAEILDKIQQQKQQQLLQVQQQIQQSNNNQGATNQFLRNQNMMEMESINSEYGYTAPLGEVRRKKDLHVTSQKSDRSNQKTRQAGKSLSTAKNQKLESPLDSLVQNANGTRLHRQSLGGNGLNMRDLSSSSKNSKTSTPERQYSDAASSHGATTSQGSITRRYKSKELRQQSVTSSVRFHLSVSESEDEQTTSLERIHTFNLKAETTGGATNTSRSQSSTSKEKKGQKKEETGKDKAKKKSKIKSLKQLLNVKVLNKGSAVNDSTASMDKKRDLSQRSSQLLSQSTRDHQLSTKAHKLLCQEDKSLLLKQSQKMKQCYVEEAAKLRDSFMIESYKILKSLLKNLEIFLVHLYTEAQSQKLKFLRERDIAQEALDVDKFVLSIEVTQQRMAKLFREFGSLQQIEQLRRIDRYKYVGRNMLGVRKYDDWINNLEIGNIMHLNPITTQELMQNVGKHHEFQKDPMLKKLVLLSVSLFSIATEMRMMVQFDQKDKDTKEVLQHSSEIWHAQAVFFGAYYLPANCPLVTHIGNSYNKHYILNRKALSPRNTTNKGAANTTTNLISHKKDSFQKNKGLQNFLQSQQQQLSQPLTQAQNGSTTSMSNHSIGSNGFAQTQLPPKVTATNNSITNIDKTDRSLSYNGGYQGAGGASSSYENNNTSDNQDHQVLTEQQKQRPIVSLQTINPLYQAVAPGVVKKIRPQEGASGVSNKLKLQLKKSNVSSKFHSESSVSPVRQENEDREAFNLTAQGGPSSQQQIDNMKKTRYEKLSKFLKQKELQRQHQQQVMMDEDTNRKHEEIMKLLEKSFSPRIKSSQESLRSSMQGAKVAGGDLVSMDQVIQIKNANLTQNINTIAINQINSINIFPSSTKSIENLERSHNLSPSTAAGHMTVNINQAQPQNTSAQFATAQHHLLQSQLAQNLQQQLPRTFLLESKPPQSQPYQQQQQQQHMSLANKLMIPAPTKNRNHPVSSALLSAQQQQLHAHTQNVQNLQLGQSQQHSVNKTQLNMKPSLNSQLISISQTRENSTGQKKKVTTTSLQPAAQTIRPGSSKGELKAKGSTKKQQAVGNSHLHQASTSFTPSRQQQIKQTPTGGHSINDTINQMISTTGSHHSKAHQASLSSTKTERRDAAYNQGAGLIDLSIQGIRHQTGGDAINPRQQLTSQSQLSNYHPNVKLNNYLVESTQVGSQSRGQAKNGTQIAGQASKSKGSSHQQYAFNQLEFAGQGGGYQPVLQNPIHLLESSNQNIQLRLGSHTQQLADSQPNSNPNTDSTRFKMASQSSNAAAQLSLQANQSKNYQALHTHIKQQLQPTQNYSTAPQQLIQQQQQQQQQMQMKQQVNALEEWKQGEASPKLRVRKSPPSHTSYQF